MNDGMGETYWGDDIGLFEIGEKAWALGVKLLLLAGLHKSLMGLLTSVYLLDESKLFPQDVAFKNNFSLSYSIS